MTDTSDSSFAARDARITPEGVAGRSFSQAKRGFAESEVRAYLRLIADDLASSAARERELAARVRDLEEQLRRPILPPSDQDLIAALGEETARVLGQAREAAMELRAKAEEHARRVVREAQETARELRSTTQQAVEAKTREAEDSARARAKEIVAEARTLRERVLADLNERKQGLEQQVSDLRSGRGRLVETYELVERALAHATRVIAEEPSSAPEVPSAPGEAPEPEPRPESGDIRESAPEPAAPTNDPVPEAAKKEPVPEATTKKKASGVPAGKPVPEAAEQEPVPEATTKKKASGVPAGKPVPEAAKQEPVPEAAKKEPVPEASGEETVSTDVGALFEKLRSVQTAPVEAAPVERPVPEAAGTAAPTPAAPEPEAAEPEPSFEPEAELTGDQRALAAREVDLAEVGAALARGGKRALQDEQNDVLDGLRRQRGKIDIAKVLPSPEDQLARWVLVLQPSVDRAYSLGAGSVAVGGKVVAAPRGLLTELATATVTPLRDRLTSSIESIDTRSTPADTEIAVAQSLGARYREWRGQELELVLGDALAVAYSRGVYDTAPDGARLRWIPTHEGKCPDCDDNALEPTVKGTEFPTGQAFPPAHPGCRCLLAVDVEA